MFNFFPYGTGSWHISKILKCLITGFPYSSLQAFEKWIIIPIDNMIKKEKQKLMKTYKGKVERRFVNTCSIVQCVLQICFLNTLQKGNLIVVIQHNTYIRNGKWYLSLKQREYHMLYSNQLLSHFFETTYIIINTPY